MGPALTVAGTRAQSASAATIAPAKPTVAGASGVLLALVWSKNNATHATATPGWSQLGAQQNSGASFTASLWIAAEGAAAPTFTWTGATSCGAQIAYIYDPNNPLDTSVSAIGASTGISATHVSSSITSTRDNSLAVYVDAAAANTAIATPTGWAEIVDNGSATDSARDAFGTKLLATTGTTSGAISVTGANAAWVQWQLEIRPTAPGGLQASKDEAAAWLEGGATGGFSKVEGVAWLEAGALQMPKAEAVAWLDAGSLQVPKAEAVTWLDAGSLQVALAEAVAWIEGAPAPASNRRMSLM